MTEKDFNERLNKGYIENSMYQSGPCKVDVEIDEFEQVCRHLNLNEEEKKELRAKLEKRKVSA